MISFRDYSVRMWSNGDISMSSRDELDYATLHGMDGIQCNAHPHLEEYKRVYRAAHDVASAFKELDAALDAVKNLNVDKS